MNRAAQRSKCFKGWIAVVCLAGAMIVVLSLNPMLEAARRESFCRFCWEWAATIT